MTMRLTASKLRENIYRILDEAIATGAPVEVVRKGTVLRISASYSSALCGVLLSLIASASISDLGNIVPAAGLSYRGMGCFYSDIVAFYNAAGQATRKVGRSLGSRAGIWYSIVRLRCYV